MIPIVDFCFRGFQPVVVPNMTVAQLQDEAVRRGDRLFVVHDPQHGLSALIIPELVGQFLARSPFPPFAPAAEAGILDLLRRDQIIVPEHAPARVVAEAVAWQRSQAVIAVDERRFPSGVFIPAVVLERLPATDLIQHASPATLQASVAEFTAARNLSATFIAIDAVHERFHSENLNQRAAEAYVCDDHGLAHYTDECDPCNQGHRNVTCRRRTVS